MGITRGCVVGPHTAECVSFGHPDKLMDRIADAIVDAILKENQGIGSSTSSVCKATIAEIVLDHQFVLMGEMSAREMPDVESIAHRVWIATGHGSSVEPAILDYIVRVPSGQDNLQAEEASDQGVVIGYATDETPKMLPGEFVLARRLWDRALTCRDDGSIPWMHTDITTQVTLDAESKFTSAVLIARYEEGGARAPENGVADGDNRALSPSAYHELLDVDVAWPLVYNGFNAAGYAAPTRFVSGSGEMEWEIVARPLPR